MVRWSAHLGYLYTELPLVDRIAAAARDGFNAIEHPAPYGIPATEMRARLNDLGLTFSQITSGMGDPQAGEKGLACLAGREAEFREGVLRAIDYASVVGCPYIHPMAGVPKGDDPSPYRDNIATTVELARDAGMRVLVEAITIPGYAMGTLDKAAALQDELADHLDLLFDTYHAKVLDVEAVEWIAREARRIGHVHIADHPGRHEPGTGQINFQPILKALFSDGYRGAVGFEYVPSRPTPETISFLDDWKLFANTFGEK